MTGRGPRTSERTRAWVTVLAVLAVLVAGLLYLRTGTERRVRPAPAPLASPAVTPGAVGGLLPDVTLSARSGPRRARDLRPAVLLLADPACDCVRAVRQVVGDATRSGVVTYVITAGDTRVAAEALAAQAGGDAGALADPDGVLARTYGLRTDAALVLVRRDGVVSNVVAGVATSLDLRALLQDLG